MLTLVPEAIELYAASHADAVSPLLEELRVETHAKMKFPQMQVGRIEGAFLRMLVRLTGAKRVLEIGMFTGYSALCMAEGLPEVGTIVTCDVDPNAEAIARSYFARSPHGKKIDVRIAPALGTIAKLSGPFDLVFIDADKTNYANYYDAVFPLVRAGGLIVADNTLWIGSVLDPKTDDARAIASYNAKVAADPRVAKVLLTVRDGMLLAQKLG
jgi:caffeoyl-CoA O-methyltransferase